MKNNLITRRQQDVYQQQSGTFESDNVCTDDVII